MERHVTRRKQLRFTETTLPLNPAPCLFSPTVCSAATLFSGPGRELRRVGVWAVPPFRFPNGRRRRSEEPRLPVVLRLLPLQWPVLLVRRLCPGGRRLGGWGGGPHRLLFAGFFSGVCCRVHPAARQKGNGQCCLENDVVADVFHTPDCPFPEHTNPWKRRQSRKPKNKTPHNGTLLRGLESILGPKMLPIIFSSCFVPVLSIDIS